MIVEDVIENCLCVAKAVQDATTDYDYDGSMTELKSIIITFNHQSVKVVVLKKQTAYFARESK